MNTSQGIVVGMDEAGRGSWAGPVVAAAVILPDKARLPGINDSKQLTEELREILFKLIIKRYHYGIGLATHNEVDEFGLLHATFRAYKRAFEQLTVKPDHILIDGRDKFSFDVPHTSIIRGDQTVRSIMAASILAKVTRDRLMKQLAKEYPSYGFERHKGYGTKYHQEALKEYGPSRIHRKYYKPLIQQRCMQNAFL